MIDLFKRILKATRNPKLAMLYVLNFKIFRILPDRQFQKIEYRIKTGKKLDIDNPKLFNEKLQWLKLHDRKPEYTIMVDKYEVRKYVAEKIGEEHLIPLLGVYNSFDEIDFSKLPNQFVLKPNHTSGNVFICKDKSKIDYVSLRKEVHAWMKRRYYWAHREWPYKDVKPRIVCEKYLSVNDSVPDDYKFMCFNGEPRIVQVHHDRFGTHTQDNYDTSWSKSPIINTQVPNSALLVDKPRAFEKMMYLARKLAAGTRYSRIDFYEIEGRVFFGEITLYPRAGCGSLEPSEYEILLGEWIHLGF